VENRNGHAHVRIDYTLLGRPLTTESDLVELDGRWYSEDVLQNVREAHERLLAPPAPAGSAPAPAMPASVSTPIQAMTTKPPAKH